MLESNNMAPDLLLASNSPRRRQLLGLTGWVFDVCPVDIDESVLPGEFPAQYVLRLAQQKAQAAGYYASAGQLILAADTTVTDGTHILGKPFSPADARQMLTSLRGRDHRVLTAVAIYDPVTCVLHSDLCETRVWMRDYSDLEMDDYIDSGDPLDKAGAYAIQNSTFHPVQAIEGCYACVVGLPLCRVVNLMRVFGRVAPQDVTWDCQNGNNHTCAVYRAMEQS